MTLAELYGEFTREGYDPKTLRSLLGAQDERR
jgi:hypothetical protein